MRTMYRIESIASSALAALTLAIGLGAGTAFAQATAAPTGSAQANSLDLEFWKAAAKIDTVDSYQAYLSAYPSGTYAVLARAAIAKLSQSAQTGAQATSDVKTPDSSSYVAELKPFSAPSETGSLEFSVGDRFVGPGAVQVGWLGAKKQMVVPNGDWVVLAAFDHNSKQTSPVQMTTVALGQFDSVHLRSLIVATFNRRPTPAVAGSASLYIQSLGLIPRWTEAEECESAANKGIHHEASAAGLIRRCAVSRLLTQGDQASAGLEGTLWQRVESAVNALGGRLSGFHLRSDVFLIDSRSAYLQYVRLDCLAVADSRGPCDAAASPDAKHPKVAAALKSRVDWLHAFAPIAADGFTRKLNVELVPGKADTSAVVALPH